MIPKFALSGEAGEYSLVQTLLQKPQEEGEDSGAGSQPDEEMDKMAELLSTDPQFSQDAATLAGRKSGKGNRLSS